MVHWDQNAGGAFQEPVGRDRLEEAPLFDHEGDHAAFGFKQLGRRLGNFAEEVVDVVARAEKGCGEVAQALQLAIACGGAVQSELKPSPLLHRDSSPPSQCDECQDAGHEAEENTRPLLVVDEVDPDPSNDHGCGGDRSGAVEAPPE
jgi:hypothetical protein